MGAMQAALRDVGFQPTPTRTVTLESFIDGLVEPLIKVRTIQVQRAGSHYKARYAGEASCCFGETPQDATRRLDDLPQIANNTLKFEREAL